MAYFLWQKFVTGRVEWEINESRLKMRWINQFAFHKNEDIFIKCTEIESIPQGPNPSYDTLKIKLFSGKRLKFYHDNLTTRDNYEEFKKKI